MEGSSEHGFTWRVGWNTQGEAKELFMVIRCFVKERGSDADIEVMHTLSLFLSSELVELLDDLPIPAIRELIADILGLTRDALRQRLDDLKARIIPNLQGYYEHFDAELIHLVQKHVNKGPSAQ